MKTLDINELEGGERILCVHENKVKKCIWWNWSTMHCPGYTDLITFNLKLNPKKGDTLEEEDQVRINRKFLFITKKEAEAYLNI